MGVYLYFVFFYLDMEVNWFKFDGFILCFYNFIGRFEVLFGFFFFFEDQQVEVKVFWEVEEVYVYCMFQFFN